MMSKPLLKVYASFGSLLCDDFWFHLLEHPETTTN